MKTIEIRESCTGVPCDRCVESTMQKSNSKMC